MVPLGGDGVKLYVYRVCIASTRGWNWSMGVEEASVCIGDMSEGERCLVSLEAAKNERISVVSE